MQAAILALKLLPLLLICSIGPGLLVVRRLHWSPLEKLCGAVAASFVLTYLASFILFCFNAPPIAYWCVAGAFGIIGVVNYRQLLVFFRSHQTPRVLIAFTIVLAWDFMHLAIVRNYGGDSWGNDWHEHYERTCYFLHQHSNQFLYLKEYLLPARPPMMNAICAFYGAMIGMDLRNQLSFEVYSGCCLFLNASAFLPCCLLLRHLARRGLRRVSILAVLFMLNPSIMENATWTITKAFAAEFVVLGVCFYLRGLRSRDSSRLIAAALSLAAGILAHYSAAPYALAIALHYLWTLRTRRPRILEPLAAALGAIALLATWFGWSIAVFGFHNTFLSNTTATAGAKMTFAENIKKIFLNMFTAIVPHPFHRFAVGLVPAIHNWGDLRDYFFMMYQTTLPMMIGSVAGIAAGCLLVFKTMRSKQYFWAGFVIFAFVVGTAANPQFDRFGTAEVVLQTLGLIGVTMVSASLLEVRRPFFLLLIAGAAADYALGVLLQFNRESYAFRTTVAPGHGTNLFKDPTLGLTAFNQFADKIIFHFRFWGDDFAPASVYLQAASALIALFSVCWLARARGGSFSPEKPTDCHPWGSGAAEKR
jgi:hypothetical protein